MNFNCAPKSLLLLIVIGLMGLGSAIDVTCDTFQAAYDTVNNLLTDPFQISSFNLATYSIPSLINSACGGIGSFGNNNLSITL